MFYLLLCYYAAKALVFFFSFCDEEQLKVQSSTFHFQEHVIRFAFTVLFHPLAPFHHPLHFLTQKDSSYSIV